MSGPLMTDGSWHASWQRWTGRGCEETYCHLWQSAPRILVGLSGSWCLCSPLKRGPLLSPVTQKVGEPWNVKADIDLTCNHESHSTWNAQIRSCKHADIHEALAIDMDSSVLTTHVGHSSVSGLSKWHNSLVFFFSSSSRQHHPGLHLLYGHALGFSAARSRSPQFFHLALYGERWGLPLGLCVAVWLRPVDPPRLSVMRLPTGCS